MTAFNIDLFGIGVDRNVSLAYLPEETQENLSVVSFSSASSVAQR